MIDTFESLTEDHKLFIVIHSLMQMKPTGVSHSLGLVWNCFHLI